MPAWAVPVTVLRVRKIYLSLYIYLFFYCCTETNVRQLLLFLPSPILVFPGGVLGAMQVGSKDPRHGDDR